MRAFLVMERRLQDLETRVVNSTRQGKVTDVKFDDDKKRWYVRMEDGEGDLTHFKSSGWLPWQSFSHGTIGVSMPPRKGQKVSYSAPGGQPEMAFVQPHHNDPDNVSPTGKIDEIHKVIESPDKDDDGKDKEGDKYEHWQHETATGRTVIIKKKKTKAQSGAGQKAASGESKDDPSGKAKRERKLPEVTEDGDDDTLQIKQTKDGYLITFNKKKAKIKISNDQIETKYGDKTTVVVKDDSVTTTHDKQTHVVNSGGVTSQNEKGKVHLAVDGTVKAENASGAKVHVVANGQVKLNC